MPLAAAPRTSHYGAVVLEHGETHADPALLVRGGYRWQARGTKAAVVQASALVLLLGAALAALVVSLGHGGLSPGRTPTIADLQQVVDADAGTADLSEEQFHHHFVNCGPVGTAQKEHITVLSSTDVSFLEGYKPTEFVQYCQDVCAGMYANQCAGVSVQDGGANTAESGTMPVTECVLESHVAIADGNPVSWDCYSNNHVFTRASVGCWRNTADEAPHKLRQLWATDKAYLKVSSQYSTFLDYCASECNTLAACSGFSVNDGGTDATPGAVEIKFCNLLDGVDVLETVPDNSYFAYDCYYQDCVVPDGACDCFGHLLDECGVCNGSGMAPGQCDCHGNTVDACGVCGGDGPDACGVCGGDGIDWSTFCDCDNSKVDECGVCGGPGLDECGVCGGDGIPAGECDCAKQVEDVCGVCGGAGIPATDCDCHGHQLDECGVCGGNGPDECGVCGGNGIPDGFCSCLGATLDECGVCGGPGMDECGICGGPGVPKGACDCSGAVQDACGVCGGDGIPDGACNCQGDVEDYCGVCGGPGVQTDLGFCDCNGSKVDECGICGGSGVPEGTCDCEGTPIPEGKCNCYGSVLDACGECGGDGMSCAEQAEEKKEAGLAGNLYGAAGVMAPAAQPVAASRNLLSGLSIEQLKALEEQLVSQLTPAPKAARAPLA